MWRWKLFIMGLKALRPFVVQTGTCSNRSWKIFRIASLELRTVLRNVDRPDGYSREELTEMLRLVREHEGRQGWRAPDPRWS